MGVPEPAGPLWAAVKAVHDSWPQDDEMVAGDVAGAWRRGGDAVVQGASATARAGGDAVAAWRDPAGTDFHGRVGDYTSSVSKLHQQMGALAARGEHYSRELTSAKQTITTTIANNENTFALLGNPLFGALGPALRTGFATKIATALQDMIAAKAAGLRANPAGPETSSPQLAAMAADQPSITRGLTPAEIAMVRSVFGDSLDTSKIQLTEGGLLGIGGYARTIPGLVTFPDGTLTNPPAGFDRWLIHELTHAYQYQRGHTIEDLLPAAIVGDYDYGGEQGLRDALAQGKTFNQFNYEEQADIVADYYAASHRGADTSAYDPFITNMRTAKNVAPDWPPLTYPDFPVLPR